MLKTDEIVERFLEYFREKDHKYVRSSSLIPDRDKTLLFTSAGMVQFKPFWSGEIPLEYSRAMSVQKCLRLSDLGEVGKTYWHDTFFEMLGNFSFGDYFKEETIKWAWEFLTDILKIKPEKLYISVYPDDDTSYSIWRNEIGIPEKKIVEHEDNFWGPAGGLGACGPDTEIFYDLGEEYGDCEFDAECERYIELWNLVFPQYDQKEDERVPLKNRGVDTGMGLERLVMVIQDKPSIFETDLFYPIIQKIVDISGVEYSQNRQIFNIMSDHVRALAFAITDGVYPSNEGRGYVLRRLIRRALTKAREINVENSILYKLVPVVISIMGSRYHELKEKVEQISLIIKSEEENFLATLNTGISILGDIVKETRKDKRNVIRGEDAFRLYDTYGFPLTLTEEIAEEKGLKVDRDGFEEEMIKQKERARNKHDFSARDKTDWKILSNEETEFVGYEKYTIETEIVAHRESDNYYEIILRETPFYAEEGGQVGDQGTLSSDSWNMKVEETFPSPLGNVHRGKVEGKFDPSGKVKASIDRNRRYAIRKNHTTTHILHKILRKSLGEWVKQEGSYVAPDHFRFDFTHPKPLNDDEKDLIEREVNRVITEGKKVTTSIIPYEEAIKKGAVALFGEHYGDIVRVVTIDDFSKELCGGTHLNNTVEAGIFKITSETGIASGVRRIEGVTGWHAYKWINEMEDIIQKVEFLMDTDRKSITGRLEKTLEKNREQKRLIEEMEERLAELKYEELLEDKSSIDGIDYIAARVDGSRDTVRKLAERLRVSLSGGLGLLTTVQKNSVFVVVFVGSDLTDRFNAGEIVRSACRIIGGSGGGRPERAEGGGSEVSKINEMIDKFPGIVEGLRE